MNHHPILEQSNVELITNVCSAFIREKYQATLEDTTMRKILVSIFKKQVTYYTAHPPFPSLEELNKRAIGEVRDFVIQQKQGSQTLSMGPQAPPPPPSTPPQFNPNYQSQSHHPPQQNEEIKLLQQQQFRQREALTSQYNPLPPPQIQTREDFTTIPAAATEMSTVSYNDTIDFTPTDRRDEGLDKNEDDFFQKLQLLEMQRQQNISVHQPTINPVSGTVDEKTIIPQVPTNTIIYMNHQDTSEIIRNIKPVILKGHDRSWIHSPERHTIIFNGPLPDSMHIRLSKIMLPKRVSRSTPCVNLVIRSATDKRMEVLCAIDKEGPIWDIWKPISARLALIKTFACPWTIQLQDIFTKPLSMGKDAIQIVNVKQLSNNNTKLIIGNEYDNDLQSYGQILVQNKDGVIEHIDCLHVFENQIELAGTYANIQPIDSYICNLQAQAYIVLEMEKYEGEKEEE
jgi:hypothetical protein